MWWCVCIDLTSSPSFPLFRGVHSFVGTNNLLFCSFCRHHLGLLQRSLGLSLGGGGGLVFAEDSGSASVSPEGQWLHRRSFKGGSAIAVLQVLGGGLFRWLCFSFSFLMSASCVFFFLLVCFVCFVVFMWGGGSVEAKSLINFKDNKPIWLKN